MKTCLATSLLLLVGSATAFAPTSTVSSKISSSELFSVSNDSQQQHHQQHQQQQPSRRSIVSSILACSIVAATASSVPKVASARLEAVDRPDLLPKTPGQKVIQVEKFLTAGQVKRLDGLLTTLEQETGFRVRILCQKYPNTPGLAIRDYWDLGKEGQKDDKYIVLVVDEFGGRGNILNFNVGEGVKFALPNIFWTRLQAKYGTTFYVRDNCIDLSIVNAIEGVVTCLRSEDGYCTSVPQEGVSLKSLGMN